MGDEITLSVSLKDKDGNIIASQDCCSLECTLESDSSQYVKDVYINSFTNYLKLDLQKGLIKTLINKTFV